MTWDYEYVYPYVLQGRAATLLRDAVLHLKTGDHVAGYKCLWRAKFLLHALRGREI
jgi:hypothetical protein